MTRSQAILDWYRSLELPPEHLPKGIAAMNPYRASQPAVQEILQRFYSKYYADCQSRGLILGINPGRLGAGITGIPFTDTPALRDHCELEFPIETKEISAEFVYQVIAACGGPEPFYRKWFIGAACPLGFMRQNNRGNWVNYNYYDDTALYHAVRPYMLRWLAEQQALCGMPRRVIVLGTGKNLQYLQKLNAEAGLFDELIALEHPRYIMQYRRKNLDHYSEKYVKWLGFDPANARNSYL